MSAASPDRPPGRAAAAALAGGQPATSPSQDSIARLGLRGVIALLEQSPDGVVVCRADDRCYVYANPVACRLMGYRFEELLGRDLLMNFPEREHPAVLARFPGHPGQWTGVLALPDGTERQVTWSSTLFSAEGTRYAAAIFRDTTELRGAAAHAASLAQAAAAAAAGADLQQMLRTLAQAGLEATSAVAVALDLVDAEDKVIRSGGRAACRPGTRRRSRPAPQPAPGCPTSSSFMPAARSCSPTGGSCSPRTRNSIRCSKPWNRWTGRRACTCS